ncbi:hypothetical protein GFV12_08515 (plasmid) [Desulfurobacterium thermolithotrophum]|uniref:hypothetical protein n=1 Tax=Desulfurobacterium thermolithotrophum TaxID=64160 RepID=UPI0013D46FE5|nr:hypothetical protein [Desulfurobacterium thermolithotrophum]
MNLKADFKEAYSKSREFCVKFLNNKDFSDAPKEFKKLLKFRTFREIYNTLIYLAISRQSVSYGELARIVNERLGEDILPTQGSWLGRSFGEILGAISIYEFSVGRPLLSVLIYNATTKRPGDGFTRLVNALGFKIKESCEKERVFIAWGGYAKN